MLKNILENQQLKTNKKFSYGKLERNKNLDTKEVQKVFQNEPDFNLPEIIDLFEKVLTCPLNKPELKLDGLETRVPNALEKYWLKV